MRFVFDEVDGKLPLWDKFGTLSIGIKLKLDKIATCLELPQFAGWELATTDIYPRYYRKPLHDDYHWYTIQIGLPAFERVNLRVSRSVYEEMAVFYPDVSRHIIPFTPSMSDWKAIYLVKQLDDSIPVLRKVEPIIGPLSSVEYEALIKNYPEFRSWEVM